MMAWSDFFSGTPTIFNKKTGRIDTGLTGSVHIIDSFFKGLSHSSSGASIYYSSSSSSKLLIEKSTFISCKAGSNGGSVYFGTSGECVIAKTCGFDSSTTGSYGQFSITSVTSSSTSKNFVYDSSISSSYAPSNYAPIRLERGRIEVEKSNFSSNNLNQMAAMNCVPSSNGDDVACLISYCSAAYNTGETGSTFYLEASYIFKIDSCNFISNNNPNPGSGLILNEGRLEIKGSCIINNSATYVINNRNGNTVTVSNCTIDSSSNCKGSTNQINIPKTSFLNKIEFLETALCFAKYDAVGSLTVVPDRTKNQLRTPLDPYCYKRASIELLRAFNYIFLLTFVPPGYDII